MPQMTKSPRTHSWPNHFWKHVQPCVNPYHTKKSNILHLLRIDIWLPHCPLYGQLLPFIHPHCPILLHDQNHEMFLVVQLNWSASTLPIAKEAHGLPTSNERTRSVKTLGNSIYQHATNILVIKIKTWQKKIINFCTFAHIRILLMKWQKI
jgi:hypothetical protein